MDVFRDGFIGEPFAGSLGVVCIGEIDKAHRSGGVTHGDRADDACASTPGTSDGDSTALALQPCSRLARGDHSCVNNDLFCGDRLRCFSLGGWQCRCKAIAQGSELKRGEQFIDGFGVVGDESTQ